MPLQDSDLAEIRKQAILRLRCDLRAVDTVLGTVNHKGAGQPCGTDPCALCWVQSVVQIALEDTA